MSPLPRPTVAIVTEEQLRKADDTERFRLMREIIREAKYCPSNEGRKVC
jgi:hypothetical protein